MSRNANVQQCLSNIKIHSKSMKDSLAEGNLLQALKHCMNFLNELRTSQLSPKEYYELYIAVFDSLEYLASHLKQSHQRKQKRKEDTPFLADLYEIAQFLGNIVPRLYLMVVIGTTLMSTNNESAKELMKDMIEMCKGVQHPIRGLFLRNYLSQRSKDLLPLETEEDFEDTVDFLITNFIEMNKLWVRLQHQGHSSERGLRYKERKELKVLVGSNLVRLSQAIDDFSNGKKGFGEKFYKESIYPVITEQIIQCKDSLAQNYLIDVLIQIFPDSYHFATIDDLLNNVFLRLHPALKKSDLVSNLVDRFVMNLKFETDLNQTTNKIGFTGRNEKNKPPSLSDSADPIFESFWTFYDKIDNLQPSLSADEICLILQSLIKLTLNFQPDNYANLNKIYELAMQTLQKHKLGDQESRERFESSLWYDLLAAPVNELKSIKELLKIEYFRQLFERIPELHFKKQLSLVIIDKLLDLPEQETLSTFEEVDDVFAYLTIIIEEKDFKVDTQKDLGIKKTIKLDGGDKVVTEEFMERQEKLCRCLHLIRLEDTLKTLSALLYVKKRYLSKCAENTIHTYPALISQITNCLRLLGYRSKASNEKDKGSFLLNNFKNLSIIIDELYQHHLAHNAELILRLYLNAATVADQLKQENIAFELFQQTFVVYEESLSINKAPQHAPSPQDPMGGSVAYRLVLSIANALATLRYFSKKNYEALITKVTLYGSKLLKKHDQCRAIYKCAHLWWWCDLLIEGPSPTVASVDGDATKDASEPKETDKSSTTDATTDEDKEQNKESEQNDETQITEANDVQLYQDGKRVLECLQKALRVADSCMDPYLLLRLFVEILNLCVIFNVYGNYFIDARYVNGLIDLIRNNIANLKDEDHSRTEGDRETKLLRHIEQLFDRTLEHIAGQQASEGRLEGVFV